MPGWYVHLEVARRAAQILSQLDGGGGLSTHGNVGGPVPSSFQGGGPTPRRLAELIEEYPNYYALGAIGPDIFFFLPDFKFGNGFLARVAEWVISFYDTLDEKILGPWEDIVGPVEEDNTEEVSRLTGGLSDEISRIANLSSAIMTNALLDFASRLYDWFGILGSGVAPGYDDKLFYWSDMFHYRRTNEFARDLFDKASHFKYDHEGNITDGVYEPGLAFALGWMTHIGTDVTGHAYVNEKSGGPYRLHWQRHHLVENHIDAFVYNAHHGTQQRYQMMALSALHFWLQFDKDNDYMTKYDYFDPYNPANPMHFPDYPLGTTARDYYDRKKAFDEDSEIPPALAYFMLDTMKKTFYEDHNPDNNGGMPTHPVILEALAETPDGRPDLTLMHTDFALLYKFVKYTTTDYYKMPKPTPPDVFPNVDPPMPPGSSDDAPGDDDDDWDFWKVLLAIFAWILYLAQWIAYLATILPALVADLATYPFRYILYLFEEALYELWKAFRYLLVLEGFVMPEPDEIDLGLVQLGMPSQGPYQGLLGFINDVFGGLLGDNPNPVPVSEPVHDRLYPRQSARDDPNLVQKFVNLAGQVITPGCGLPSDPKVFSEFLRPWEYPLQNNDHSPIGMELNHTRASPHAFGQVPTILFGAMPGTDDARHQYEASPSPEVTDHLNDTLLNGEWNLGDSIHYSLYVIGQLTRNDLVSTQLPSFNLDSDRGYAYKTWDWDRHSKFTGKYNNDSKTSYQIPCTVPEQFNPNDICDTDTPHDIPLLYDFTHPMPLAIHYLGLLKKGEQYPGCNDDQPPPIG